MWNMQQMMTMSNLQEEVCSASRRRMPELNYVQHQIAACWTWFLVILLPMRWWSDPWERMVVGFLLLIHHPTHLAYFVIVLTLTRIHHRTFYGMKQNFSHLVSFFNLQNTEAWSFVPFHHHLEKLASEVGICEGTFVCLTLYYIMPCIWDSLTWLLLYHFS